MLDKIKKYLETVEDLDFAYLFGSYAAGKEMHISDVDIAIHFTPEQELLKIGYHTAILEDITGKKIDLLQLNNLYNKDANMAFEIISTGKLLVNKKNEEQVNFKRLTYLYYFDTEPLRNIMNESFINRLNSRNFGNRNYKG